MQGFLRFLRLPRAARNEAIRDNLIGLSKDLGLEVAIREAVSWICRAQDNSASKDGGVAHHYSLLTGWSSSYPETTGYIVPTMLEYARVHQDENIRQRAKRMLDWLVSIQFPDGAFQGGRIDAEPRVPVTFNTGQILLGLAAGSKEFGGDYLEPMRRAADWLVGTQDPDGCWRKFPTPLTAPGEKAYETHVAWGLLEAARVDSSEKYANAALANIHWALKQQKENGWFAKCCLSDPSQPLTHTIGYAFRGIVEAYQFNHDGKILQACERIADGLLSAMGKEGFLPGRIRSNWQGAVKWVCLTGTAQIAHCWLKMFQFTGKLDYRVAGLAANQYVRRTIRVDGDPGIRGGIKGSFPIGAKYCPYQYPNWAVKFCIDANALEKTARVNFNPPN